MGRLVSEVARMVFEDFAKRDREALVALSHPEVEIHLVTNEIVGRDGPYRGHSGVREYIDDVERVWDELVLQPRQYVELEDSRVLVLGRVRSRRGATHTDVPSAWLLEVAGDKVRSVRLFVDSATIAALLDARVEVPAA